MVRLFRKKTSQHLCSKKELEDLKKNAYSLGFEVGYHKHSEIGWVKADLNQLYKHVHTNSHEKIIRNNYNNGKQQGLVSRERDLAKGLFNTSSKVTNKSTNEQINVSNQFESLEDNNITNSFGLGYCITNKPYMLNLPKRTSLAKIIQKPSQIDGFKLLNLTSRKK
ncbi:hypothetical protein [Methanosalsum natronophilum]|uniref:Uncharacterized protein n=1 Tax=Methanosalsum natronophilum TaxID=768733 RepID=A0A3R7VV75_9EURY|nr:hypothetical protein [Methanosalsum natronophilum]MCS3923935.1 hypothetical protein [Methanosalsum natronophilum]RQD81044.1 MAG: hypothetical protein D5R95_08360 [Methanosalsum natronophilum]